MASRNTVGRATEALQYESIHKQNDVASADVPPPTPEPIVIPPTPAPETLWWFIDAFNHPIQLTAAKVQEQINNTRMDTKVCPVGGSTWVLATEAGFKIPTQLEASTDAVATESRNLGEHEDPKKERLETFPDTELKALASKYGVIAIEAQYDRAAVIAALAKMNIAEIGL